jgi:hypothetical protein
MTFSYFLKERKKKDKGRKKKKETTKERKKKGRKKWNYGRSFCFLTLSLVGESILSLLLFITKPICI